MSNLVNIKITKRLVAIVCLLMLLIAAVVGVAALRNRRQHVPPPELPTAQTPAEVHVKAVERMGETLDLSNVETAKFSNKRPRRATPEFGIQSL